MGAIFRKQMTCPGMRGDTFATSCAKWLNRSTCRLGCELHVRRKKDVLLGGTLATPGEYD